MKNKTHYIVLVFLYLSFSLNGQESLKDSLNNLLLRVNNPQQRVDILINLKDLYEPTNNEFPYAVQLFNEANKINDKFAVMASLGTICSYYVDIQNPDSLNYYLDKADSLLTGSEYDGITTYYRMAAKARVIQTAERKDRAEICEYYSTELEKNKSTENRFQQAERLFLNGIITYQLMSLSENNSWEKGIPFWEEAWTVIQDFPLTVRKSFAANLSICLITTYSGKKDKKLLDIANSYLNMLDEYFAQDEICKRRPYIYKEIAYAICYQRLILSDDIIGREKTHEYYLRYNELIQSGKGDNFLHDKTFFYDISCKHFLRRKDYSQALAFKDSLIRMMEKGNALSTMNSSQYRDKAEILKLGGRYKEACNAYEKAIMLKDSLVEKEYISKVGEMRVKYEVDKLELDNANLLAEKRKTALNFAICIIFIIVTISIYLYYNLKKVKRLQNELIKESQKAQESENMKTAFINSMCHEIRTPLNAINGFSDLITDDTITAEEKKTFPTIIRENSNLLTGLLNDLLEISNLDSSSSKFPMEETDVYAICVNEMKRLQNTEEKKGIDYHLDLSENSCYINTHAKYFSLSIRALLNNANKFTNQGEIRLNAHIDKEEEKVVFTVSDTGCGIPEDKSEYIFERFAKINQFTQGTGMGLYLCRLIAKRMNGNIELDKTYKAGAKFTFIVPLH